MISLCHLSLLYPAEDYFEHVQDYCCCFYLNRKSVCFSKLYNCVYLVNIPIFRNGIFPFPLIF